MASMNAAREPNVRIRTEPRFGQRADLHQANLGPDPHRSVLALGRNETLQKADDPSTPNYSGVHPGSGTAKE
jgi:hypothetical protein